MLALWSSFALNNGHELTELNMGVPADSVAEMMEASRDGCGLRSLEAELSIIPLLSTLSAQHAISPEGVFVAYYLYGSPASRSALVRLRRIVQVDGMPTLDLDAFLSAVVGKPDRASVLLKTLTWNNVLEVITLKLDQSYWPTYELVRTQNGWERSSRE